MKTEGLDHVAVAVKDLDAATAFYRDVLGFELLGREVVEHMRVEVAVLSAGDLHVELVRPTVPGSGVAKFLDKRGEGIHHLALKVKGIEKALEDFVKAGGSVIDEKPRTGARGSLVAFLHPRSCHGTLIELCERPEP